MKVIVHIEINDDDRCRLADLIDGKTSKRKVSRAEIVSICEQHLGGLLEVAQPASVQIERNQDAHAGFVSLKPDPEDIPLMKQPNNPSYVRGWITVKRSRKS